MTQNTTHANVMFWAIQQVRHLGRGREQTKKATKNDIEREVRSQKSGAPHANSSMIFCL